MSACDDLAGSCQDIAAPLFAYALRTVTEAAARAAYDWIGRGDKGEGDRAAMQAMRAGLNRLPIDAEVIVGEGEKDEVRFLYTGERLGERCHEMKFDAAVDPVEGTSYLARGMTNALACVALAPRGTMMRPGPAFYMEKFVGPPELRGQIDPSAPVEERLAVLARVLGKPVKDLTIYVLEKPRHRDLVARLHKAGARVALYPAGDVAGAIMAAIPESGIDALMGTGGTPEGLLAACAIRALGGTMMARIDPQLTTERAAVEALGLDTSRWLAVEEMVTSDQVYFCATGITTGLLLDGVERSGRCEKTHTLMVTGARGEREFLTTHHRRDDV